MRESVIKIQIIIYRTHPDLQFNAFVVPEDGLYFKVDSHRWDEGRRKGVIGIAEQETRLAHTGVADDEQFEHVVKVLVRSIFLPLWITTTGHL